MKALFARFSAPLFLAVVGLLFSVAPAFAQTDTTPAEIISSAVSAMTNIVGTTVIVVVIIAAVTLAIGWRFLSRVIRIGR